jgi:hypothetical protein
MGPRRRKTGPRGKSTIQRPSPKPVVVPVEVHSKEVEEQEEEEEEVHTNLSEPEEEEEVQQDVASQSQSQSQEAATPEVTPSKKKKQSRVPSYLFTDEQEMDIATWWQANECLYIKRLKSYQNAEMKIRIVTEKASSLNPPATCK